MIRVDAPQRCGAIHQAASSLGLGEAKGQGGFALALAMLVSVLSQGGGGKLPPRHHDIVIYNGTPPISFPWPLRACPQARVTSALVGTTGSDTPLPAFPEPARGRGLGARSPHPARGRWPGGAPPRPARRPRDTEPGTAGRRRWADPLLSARHGRRCEQGRRRGCCRGPERGQSATEVHLD